MVNFGMRAASIPQDHEAGQLYQRDPNQAQKTKSCNFMRELELWMVMDGPEMFGMDLESILQYEMMPELG